MNYANLLNGVPLNEAESVDALGTQTVGNLPERNPSAMRPTSTKIIGRQSCRSPAFAAYRETEIFPAILSWRLLIQV